MEELGCGKEMSCIDGIRLKWNEKCTSYETIDMGMQRRYRTLYLNGWWKRKMSVEKDVWY